ncbi:MAG: uroporphyrinogen-III synthase [Nitrosopumilaceae archaeon]|nr:uroporphyrinogen-III synthase [Nitrosopumilaceae archaeon]
MTLHSRNVAITRGPEDAAEFISVVEREGGRAIPLPTIRLVGRGESVSAEYLRESGVYNPDYTVFMSSKAVRLLMEDARSRGTYDETRLAVANTIVVAVGPKTAAALEGYDIRVNAMPESVYSSVGVGEVMSRMDRAKSRVLVPRSGASTPFLRELLEKEGFDVLEVHLYDVEPHPGGPVWEEFAAMLGSGDVHGMVFTSVSSVRAFFHIMERVAGAPIHLEGVAVVSIGPFTSEELERFGVSHHVSGVHTVAGSLDALRGALG